MTLHSDITFHDIDRDLTERDFILAVLDCAIKDMHDSIAAIGVWFKTEWLLDPLYNDIAEMVIGRVRANQPLTSSVVAKCLRSHTDRYTVSPLVAGELILSANGGAHLEFWGREVYDQFRRRSASGEISAAADTVRETTDVQSALDDVTLIPEKYPDIDITRTDKSSEAVQAIIAELEGVTTPHFRIGIRSLDDITRGFRNGSLITVAAPPGQGKSVMLGQMAAVRATRDNRHVLFFSAEMSHQELLWRWSSWSSQATRSKSDRRAYIDGLNVMGKATRRDGPLQVFEGGRHISSILSIARSYVATHNLGLICVDYVQRFDGATVKDNRERQIADISQKLKSLAGELSIPVVMACQYNRDYKGSPSMRNLRESGALEQDSDIIIHLESPADTKDEDVEVSVFVEKNRHGCTGKCTIRWNKPRFTFRDDDPKPHSEFEQYAE